MFAALLALTAADAVKIIGATAAVVAAEKKKEDDN